MTGNTTRKNVAKGNNKQVDQRWHKVMDKPELIWQDKRRTEDYDIKKQMTCEPSISEDDTWWIAGLRKEDNFLSEH